MAMAGMEVLLLMLLLYSLVISMQRAAPVAAAVGFLRPPAMFVFGDSLLDVGNNNYLPGADVPRANKPYYGIDFPGGKPTGRFSNGYNTADYIAKSMGFAISPPPYLSLLPDNNSSSSRLLLAALTNGVSYASADAGILDSTNAGKCIPLSTQLRYFNATRAEMVAAVGSVAVSALLSKSIFLIGIGSNDMFASTAAEQQSDDAVAAFYAGLISNYSAAVTELHSMGARKFAVINVGEVGCVPTLRLLDDAAEGGQRCADGPNRLAAGFDDALRQLLADDLAPRLPGLVYSLADSFNLSRDTFADPQASGYAEIAAACCGSGRLLAEADCLPNSTLCGNRNDHVFWDRFHPSQRACKLTAQAFYDGPAQYTTPINFMQLAHAAAVDAVVDHQQSKTMVSPRRQVPAMYVFGDSTLDVGNNNHLQGKGVPRANKPYYGIDLPGAAAAGKPIPTGRFSNGYNVADFVAKNLGFEKSPLAYLVLKARNYLIPSAITRGVSYASAGAGILDSTNAGDNIPLSQQVRLFASTKAEMEAKMGPAAVTHLLSRSFFLVGVGSNDFFAFATAQAAKKTAATQSDVAAFYASLVSNYSAAITDLYELGARKIGIINVGPVGCVPRVRVLNATGGCADALNQLAAGFDAALRSLLAGDGLARELPGLSYSIADSYAFTTATDPRAVGFADAVSACCGGGRLGAEADCLPGAALCADRDRYLFWDRVHPSQRAAMISAQAYYDGPSQFTAPITFKQLAETNN